MVFKMFVLKNTHTKVEQSIATYEQPQCLLVVFCTGGPRTRNIRTYFIWYGHCRAAPADSFCSFRATDVN